MPRNEVRIVVLFEDDEHECFLRRLVERLHLNPVRYVKCTDCNGVLARVGPEVEALRRKKHQKNLGLLIVIDADGPSREKRLAELEAIITKDNGAPRENEERIAFVIPAWEIETWYVHFCCPEMRPVDESRDDYKRDPAWRRLKAELGVAAKRAAEAWLSENNRVDPASLIAARDELQRLA